MGGRYFLVSLIFLTWFSSGAFSLSLPYKAVLFTHYPGIAVSYKESPHDILSGFHINKKHQTNFFLHYKQPKVIEAKLGSVVDKSFSDRLLHKVYFDTGLSLKTLTTPVSFQYTLLPIGTHLELKWFENYGVSLLSEDYDSLFGQVVPKERHTFSVFGDLPLGGNSTLFLTASLSQTKGQGSLADNKGIGYTIAFKMPTPLSASSNGFLDSSFLTFTKINWQWDSFNDLNYFHPEENFVFSYFKELSYLRNKTNTDVFLTSFTFKKKLQKKMVLSGRFDYSQNPKLYYASLGFRYRIERHIGVSLRVVKSVFDPSVSIVGGVTLHHFLWW